MDEEQFSEQFERAHEHLDMADKHLDDLVTVIEAEVSDELTAAEVVADYDLDTGDITVDIPVETVASRLNKKLESSLYVSVDGGQLEIQDIRGVVGETEKSLTAKEIVGHLEDLDGAGAPEETVITYMTYVGIEDPDDELLNLKQKGEVYEPATGYLRTT